jgi:hypothetical protein
MLGVPRPIVAHFPVRPALAGPGKLIKFSSFRPTLSLPSPPNRCGETLGRLVHDCSGLCSSRLPVSWTRPSVNESSVAAGGEARGASYPPRVRAVPVLQALPRRRVPSLLSAAVGVSLLIDRRLTDSEGI